jgi:organic radical activating enzyme
MTQYPITEIFHTSQGEGLNAGRNAWFIRMGGCNYACPGCDEPLHKNAEAVTRMAASEIVDQIVKKSKIPNLVKAYSIL